MTDTLSIVEQHATRALQEVLAGRIPTEADLAALTGTVKQCIEALLEALQADGIGAEPGKLSHTNRAARSGSQERPRRTLRE